MYTSTNGGDTWGGSTSFCSFAGPSSIERIQVQIGSNTTMDDYGVALMNNLMINLTTNAVTKNSYQFLGIDGQPQPATQSTGQPVFTRFKPWYIQSSAPSHGSSQSDSHVSFKNKYIELVW